MTGEERLAILADYLDATPPHSFDIDHWDKCAVGSGAKCPALAREGLFSVPCPEYGSLRGWDAVTSFFDLEYKEAYYLFNANSYLEPENVKPAQVVERIRELLRGKMIV